VTRATASRESSAFLFFPQNPAFSGVCQAMRHQKKLQINCFQSTHLLPGVGARCRFAWCRAFRTPGALAIGLTLHVLQSVSDGLLHSLRNCCRYWPSEVVVVSHGSSKMCSKPIREAEMPRRARKNKIPAKIFNNPLFQSCVIGMRVNKVTKASDKRGKCQTPRHFGYFK